jgi:hypothetical protein
MRYVLAVLLGSCAAMATGCASRPVTGSGQSELPLGRFQIATTAIPSGGVAAYVLDTATGEVWMQNQDHRNDDFSRAKIPTRPAARP